MTTAPDDLEAELRNSGFLPAEGKKPPKKKDKTKKKKPGFLTAAFAAVTITLASGAASYAVTSAIEGHPASHGANHATVSNNRLPPKNSTQP